MHSLGIKYPKAHVVNHPSQLVAAAEGLRFPVVVEGEYRRSGAGITKYQTLEDLRAAAEREARWISVSITRRCCRNLFPRGRVHYACRDAGGKFLYAIRVYLTEILQSLSGRYLSDEYGVELVRNACAIEAPRNGLKVEGYTPPPAVIKAVETIVQQSGIDVGGIEYIIDDRDGELLYYDVNALSNFVADAVNVIGFQTRISGWWIIWKPGPAYVPYRPQNRLCMRYRILDARLCGWLRNVDDENMQPSWDYVKKLAIRSEEIGFDLSLIAELNLNDIKGEQAPSLDAWSTCRGAGGRDEQAGVDGGRSADVPQPRVLAKQAANIDHISGAGLTLNVVSSWWRDEATKYGVGFEQHDDRYARTAEWLTVLNGVMAAGRIQL